MSQSELLKHVVGTLDTLQIDYMLTGSVASSAQGQPRSTHDIDLVVNVPPDKVDLLVATYPPPDYYLSKDAVNDALRTGLMFNLLRIADGDKVGFWMLTDSAFDQSRFSRKRKESIFGVLMNVSSPEDTILAKLRWAKLSGGSEKQFNDALGVYEVQGQALDKGYLDHWAHVVGVDDEWKKVQKQARPIDDI